MPSTGSSVDLTQSRKKSVNLKIGYQKLPKLKDKEKKNKCQKIKTKQKAQATQEPWDNIKSYNICLVRNQKKKEKNRAAIYIKK